MSIDLYANKKRVEGEKYCSPAPAEDFKYICGVEEGECSIQLTRHYHRGLLVPAVDFSEDFIAETKEEIKKVLECVESKYPDTEYGIMAKRDLIDFLNICIKKGYIVSIA